MNRFVRGVAAAAVLAGGLGSVGCTGTTGAKARGVAPDGCSTCGGGAGAARGGGGLLRSLYDPCWPERYNAAARDETLEPFRNQVNNGAVMHHTIWNWYFETDPNTGLPTDRLNSAGMAKLDSIARERPAPDPRIYIQTARDVVITPPAPAIPGEQGRPAVAGNLETVADARTSLDAQRAAAVTRYLAAQPNIAPVHYELFVHDPVVLGMPSDFAGAAFRGQLQGYRGGLTSGGSGGQAVSTGGGAVIVAPAGGGAGPAPR